MNDYRPQKDTASLQSPETMKPSREDDYTPVPGGRAMGSWGGGLEGLKGLRA